MWLLDTHTLKLHFFLSPETVKEGYLILSHVWNGEEQSFQDIQWIHERCDATGEDPHDFVSPKIRKTCELAERHGYKWAWIDTCCIDKTSSAELMETINAMYKFYALALVCYVYLGDMDPADFWLKDDFCDPHVSKSDSFSRSRWNRRGWTLQELIAPRVVHFFSMDWKLVGNKEELAEGLELATGIPATVLRFQQKPDDFSVAQRMSWAAKRETRRIEDEAYCLLGLFDVSMPTLYGEGKRAFERLQEAILARTSDTTLFAWGRSVKLHDLNDRRRYALAGMLATSPSDYGSCSAIRFAPRSRISEGSRRGERKPMQSVFNITPHGILARIPLLRAKGHMLADLSWSEGDDPLFLVLRMRAPRYINTLPLYDVGVYLPPRNRWDVSPTRLSNIYIKDHSDSGSSSNCAPPIPTWKLLYLQTRSYREPEPRVYLPLNHTCPPIFRLPEHHIAHFLRYEKGWRIRNAQLPWLGTPPLMITFPYEAERDSLYVAIQFGCCDAVNRTSTGSVDLASIWANFRGSTSTADCGDQDHECPTDHILTWPHLKRTFVLRTHHTLGSPIDERDMKWLLKMSFTQTPVGTGSLTLTHISITDRTLMKHTGYRDLIEEMEAEEQEELDAWAAALLIKNNHEQEQVNSCTMGQRAFSDRQVDCNKVDRISNTSKRQTFSLARRIFYFLIRVMDQF